MDYLESGGSPAQRRIREKILGTSVGKAHLESGIKLRELYIAAALAAYMTKEQGDGDYEQLKQGCSKEGGGKKPENLIPDYVRTYIAAAPWRKMRCTACNELIPKPKPGERAKQFIRQMPNGKQWHYCSAECFLCGEPLIESIDDIRARQALKHGAEQLEEQAMATLEEALKQIKSVGEQHAKAVRDAATEARIALDTRIQSLVTHREALTSANARAGELLGEVQAAATRIEQLIGTLLNAAALATVSEQFAPLLASVEEARSNLTASTAEAGSTHARILEKLRDELGRCETAVSGQASALEETLGRIRAEAQGARAVVVEEIARLSSLIERAAQVPADIDEVLRTAIARIATASLVREALDTVLPQVLVPPASHDGHMNGEAPVPLTAAQARRKKWADQAERNARHR